jgi:hypothetical protein
MAAVLALLSTLVAAKLQLIQQWWLPIVNGWCQPFAAHAMATTQQSPPLPLMWAIVLLLFQHMLAFCSSSKLTIPRASLAKFPGTCQTFQSPESSKHPFAHSKRSLQPDGLSYLI